jgi:hypothetical protein
MITVVTVRVGQPPKIEQIENSLEGSQEVVGGDIQMVGVGNDISLVCNEDGISLGLPENGCGILGTFFFSKCDDEGDMVSLSEQECQALMTYATVYRHVRHGGVANWEVVTFDTSDDLLAFLEKNRVDEGNKN